MKRTLLSLAVGFALGIITTGAVASMRGSAVFPDVPAGSFFDEAIGEMYAAGVMTGYADGRFGPNDPVTRGQVAVMFKRFKDSIGEGDVALASSSASSRSRRSSASAPTALEASVTGQDASASFSSSSSTSEASEPDNPNGVLRFTASKFEAAEGAGETVISLVRAGGDEGVVEVRYATTAGTAQVPDDVTLASGKLTFADGESSRTFTVPIADDGIAESNETVTLTLSSPTGGALLGMPMEATLTIKDDDGAGGSTSQNGVLAFGALKYSVAENGTSVLITVERSGGSAGAVTVTFSTRNATAEAGIHYAATNGTLSFATGETSKTFPVSVTDNATINGNKGLTLLLASPTGGAVLGEAAQALLTIVDNEVGTFGVGSFKFDRQSFTGTESGRKTVIIVERVGGSRGEASVTYGTTDGTARAGTDYTAATGTLTFRDGETHKSFVIGILKDDVSDPGESINLSLGTVTGGASLASPSTADVTID